MQTPPSASERARAESSMPLKRNRLKKAEKTRKKSKFISEFRVGSVVEAMYDDGKWYDVKILKREDYYNFEVLWLADTKKRKEVRGFLQYYDMRPKLKEPQIDENKPLLSGLSRVLWGLRQNMNAWPFREPVDPILVPDYAEIISHPMDLMTMQKKLDKGKYDDLKYFSADFNLVMSNCIEYNGKTSTFSYLARALRTKYNEYMRKAFPRIRVEHMEAKYSPLHKKKTVSSVEKWVAQIKRNRANEPSPSPPKPKQIPRVTSPPKPKPNPKKRKTGNPSSSKPKANTKAKANTKQKASHKKRKRVGRPPNPSPQVISPKEREKREKELQAAHMRSLGLLPPPNGFLSPDGRPPSEKDIEQDGNNQSKDGDETQGSDIKSEEVARYYPKRSRRVPHEQSFAVEQAMDHWMRIAIEKSKEDTLGTSTISRANSITKHSSAPPNGPRIPEAGMRVLVRFDDGVHYPGTVGLCGLLCERPINIWRLYIKYEDGENIYDVFPDPKQGIRLIAMTNEEREICPLAPGDLCDCQDSKGTWLPATVVAVNDDTQELHIHFVGWASRWDERVSFAKEPTRFAPLYTFAKPTLKTIPFCPLPPPPPEPIVGLQRSSIPIEGHKEWQVVRGERCESWGYRTNECVNDRNRGPGQALWVQEDRLVVRFEGGINRYYTESEAKLLLRRAACHHCGRGSVGIVEETEEGASVACSFCGEQYCRECLDQYYSKGKVGVPDIANPRGWKCPICRRCCKCARCKERNRPTQRQSKAGVVSEPDFLPDVDTVRDTILQWLPKQQIDIPGCRCVMLKDVDCSSDSSGEEDTSDEAYYIKHTREYQAECRFWEKWQLSQPERAGFEFGVSLEEMAPELAIDDEKTTDEKQLKKMKRLRRILGNTADKDRSAHRALLNKEREESELKQRQTKVSKRKRNLRQRANKNGKIRIPNDVKKETRFNYTWSSTRWRKPDAYIQCLA